AEPYRAAQCHRRCGGATHRRQALRQTGRHHQPGRDEGDLRALPEGRRLSRAAGFTKFFVITGRARSADPVIHLEKKLDCRVKSGNDRRKSNGDNKMADTAPSLKLTYEGAAKLLAAAVAKARDMSVPQCICIVDAGGHLLTMARMDGAFALSVDTALRKAQTAAAYGIPTGDIAAGIDIKLAIATEG